MRSHRWDEPAGRHRPEVDRLTLVVRFAHADGYSHFHTYANSNSHCHSYTYFNAYFHAYPGLHTELRIYIGDRNDRTGSDRHRKPLR